MTTRNMVKNLSWLSAGNVLAKPIWFAFITYVCIRSMGLREYGMMTASLALMGIVDGIFTLGTSTLSIREIARERGKSSEYFSNFLPYRLIASALAVGTGLIIELILGNHSLLTTALFAGTYVFFMNLTDYCRALFRAHEIFRIEAISIVVEKLLVVGFGSLFLYYNRTAAGVLMGMTVGVLFTFLLNYRWVVLDFAKMTTSLMNRSFFKQNMPQAVPLGLASIFVLLYFRTDSVMIEAMQGELPTGQYAMAFRVTEALLLIPATVTAILLPRLSSLFSSGFSNFRKLSQRSIYVLFVVCLFIAFVIFAFAPVIVKTLEPSAEAEPAIALLRILVWAFPIAAINSVLAATMTASDLQKKLAWVLGFAALLNIGLNYVLIPILSATGASYATIATEVFVAVFFLALVPKEDRTAMNVTEAH